MTKGTTAKNFRPTAKNFRPTAKNFRPTAKNFRPTAKNFRPTAHLANRTESTTIRKPVIPPYFTACTYVKVPRRITAAEPRFGHEGPTPRRTQGWNVR